MLLYPQDLLYYNVGPAFHRRSDHLDQCRVLTWYARAIHSRLDRACPQCHAKPIHRPLALLQDRFLVETGRWNLARMRIQSRCNVR